MSKIYAYRGLGAIYSLKKDYIKAIAYYQKSYNIADSLGVLEEKMDCSQILGHAYMKIGDYKTATKYLDNMIALKDSVYSIEKTKQVNEMEAKYQNAQKQKEIETLGQKNEIQKLQISQSKYFIYGLASVILLIVALSFLLFRQNRINRTSERIELEQKLLRSQMNPHFIFNAMTSVQNYIYKEEPQVAANFLSSMFKLMRAIIEGSKEEYIVLEKEIITLNHYLILQQLCFQNQFDFTIDVASNIDTENTIIPPMMAQPFIENAIEHGIMNKEDGRGIISIKFLQNTDTFSVEITDNGVGRERAKELNHDKIGRHLSMATGVVKDRIDLLNKKLRKKITMQIIDLKDGQNKGIGTKVVFSFPLNKIV